MDSSKTKSQVHSVNQGSDSDNPRVDSGELGNQTPVSADSVAGSARTQRVFSDRPLLSASLKEALARIASANLKEDSANLKEDSANLKEDSANPGSVKLKVDLANPGSVKLKVDLGSLKGDSANNHLEASVASHKLVVSRVGASAAKPLQGGDRVAPTGGSNLKVSAALAGGLQQRQAVGGPRKTGAQGRWTLYYLHKDTALPRASATVLLR